MQNKLYSIILMSYYSEDRIVGVYEKVRDRMENENIPFEFIIMDDGSKDNSYQVATELEKTDNRVVAYQLSRNFTSHYSKMAAFTKCTGACATTIPDDFQMPLDMVVKMYRTWEKGHKVVIPFRESRKDGLVKDLFSNIYYRLMNSFSDVTFPKGGADGFLADREVIDIFNGYIHPINTSTTVEVLRMGFDPVFIPLERPVIEGKSRWTFRKKFKLAKDTLLSSSSFPIKMISYLGLFSFLISIALLIVIVTLKLTGQTHIGGIRVPGWASLVSFLSLFGGMILLSLGVIAEYIWLIYEEVKGRPGFIIRKK